MRIGAHVDATDPLAEAKARGADVIQFFLADPQGWKAPKPREDAGALRDSDVDIYIHSPYVINVATGNNRIRIPSRKLLLAHARAAAEVGAKGLIVHGGHVNAGDDIESGFDNWRKAFAYAEAEGGFPVPVLIENTAGGDNACARRFDMLARLWAALDGYEVGLCLDTCHAFAGGEDLVGIVDRVKGITGRIDLIHANGSKGGFDSGQDRHENFLRGEIDPELISEVVSSSGAPAVCETPGSAEDQAADIAYLRERLP
ncbi:deoxyribonuclease IV [Longispora fulva]|uniref:Deoxyribonuclease-4 n=1 Tax=Longispora fulva TaxID=619741 RepID=A0A8J7KSI1_9ACTN|nr:deoxyribonuclease IV [Longispora fulva]MBG6139662.1 deoxyribonuclease-4 [Longispora fulva]GIG57956.1 deoxyribonuclease IV [Longispora fulva]